jgi:hypothetical protein
MFDFYLIGSVALNIILFLMWKKEDWYNLCIKAFLLLLSIAGVIVVINTYNLIH